MSCIYRGFDVILFEEAIPYFSLSPSNKTKVHIHDIRMYCNMLIWSDKRQAKHLVLVSNN